MNQVTPKVYLIGQPQIDFNQLDDYLEDVGVSKSARWRILGPGTEGEASEADLLVEIGGRMCYRSWEPGLNANVTKIREDSTEYIRNILSSGHGSVLEHANFTFVLQDVSRVLTHELVRHRAGVAVSQESMRYVRLDDIPFWFPDWAMEDAELIQQCIQYIQRGEDLIKWMATRWDLDNQSFSIKKKFTSFMRRLVPGGHATSIMVTINARAIRHIIAMRTNLGAEEEIRIVCDMLAKRAQAAMPDIMQDYSPNENQEWIPEFLKV